MIEKYGKAGNLIQELKLAKIRNTLCMQEIEVSEALYRQLITRSDVSHVEGPYEMRFDREMAPLIKGNVKVYASTNPNHIPEDVPVAVANISDLKMTVITTCLLYTSRCV